MLYDFFSNKILWTAFTAWFAAQAIKILLHFVASGELKLHLIKESGGMPSSHSATVCSVCVAIGVTEGFGSSIFALAAVLAVIVMYDATNVRRATGEQGEVLIKLIDMMKLNNHFQTTLKQALGHKPLEVLVGAIIGICIGIIFY